MMQIYAIRDRLIDYYLRPFAAADDKEVMASIAHGINQGDQNSALAQAPHHFEIWRLGSVTETGDLRPGKELVADCSSLVRTGVRRSDLTGTPAPPITAERHGNPPESDGGHPSPDPRPIPVAPPGAPGTATETGQRHQGGPNGRNNPGNQGRPVYKSDHMTDRTTTA